MSHTHPFPFTISYHLFTIIIMDFHTCQQYFQKLISESALPPKMEIKLHYLQSALLQKEDPQYFDQLPEFERDSLKEMNKQTQKAIFVDIINCFATSETRQHFKDIKAKVKKRGSMTDGPSLYLTCIGNRLTVFKKRENGELWREFKLQNLEISPLYQQNKKKYTFTLTNYRHQYVVKFDVEGVCARIHGQLQNLIRQFKGPREQRKYEKNLESDIKEQERFQSAFDEEAYFLQEQRDYLKSLKKIVEDSSGDYQGRFKLLRNINNGKLEVRPNGCVRLLLFVQRCQIKRYIQSFILLDCWNTQIENFRIINHIRSNTYLAYIRLKKTSIWTSQREAYISISYFKDCSCFDKEQECNEPVRNSYKCMSKHYIIIKTIEYGQAPQNGLVRMNFNQIAEFSQIQDKKDKIFLSLTSDVDLNTYELFGGKVDINVNLLKDVPSLSILYRQKVIQNANLSLFDFDRCACNIKFIQKGLLLKEEKEDELDNAIQIKKDSIINIIDAPVRQGALTHREIMKIIFDQINNIKNQRIIDLLKNKLHESYYLKERFDFNTYQQPHIQSNFTLEEDKDFLLQGGIWKITANDIYVFTDEEELKVQKGVLKLVIKQITSNILAGKSIMSMSLPVQIFGDKSILDGLAQNLGFVPKFMHQAVQCTSPIEQIKYVAAAWMFIFACHPKIKKPFNPILGETYQGEVGGIPVFVQQISHHPPISAFYMRNEKFEAYGNFDMHVDLGLNAAYSKNYGLYHVHIFATDTRFVLRFPDLEVGGVMFGDRSFNQVGKGFILEQSSQTYLEYSVGKQRKKLYQCPNKMKASDLAGAIFTVTKEYARKARQSDPKKQFEGVKLEDVIKKHCQLSGKWYGDLFYDDVQYKSLKNGPFPIPTKKKTVLLPSDSLFREDVIYKQWKDNKRSNEEKQILQNLQRRDKKLRTKPK